MESPHFSPRTHALITAAISYLSMLLAYFIRFELLDGQLSYGFSYFHIMALLSAVLHYVIYSACFYTRPGISRFFGKQVQRTILCESAWLLLTMSLLFVVDWQDFSRLTVLISYVVNVVAVSAKHYIVLQIIANFCKSGYYQRTILLIGEGRTAVRYARTVLQRPEAGHHLLGYVASSTQPFDSPFLGGYSDLDRVLALHTPDEAIIALSPERYVHMDAIIATCEQNGVPLKIIPCYEERISSQISTSVFEDIQMIGIREIPLNKLYNAMIKRAMDIALSLTMLLLLSPLMLVTAIGVKFSTHDTVFFTQTRVGKDKKPFKMLKFRSMKKNDGEDSAWSTQTDDRRTLFGALIRKTSIDELPQLINVLRGDMSIIGPRPEIPCYVEQFRDEIPLYMIRHMVKPGMTGLAQINGYRGDTSIKKRIEFDIAYIENWTIWLDLRILLRTIPSIINDEKLPRAKK